MNQPISSTDVVPWWSLHTHTRESASDALPSIVRTVDRARELGYPALGLTDHGTQSGAVEFYLECRKAGIEPLIGVEAYLTVDRTKGVRSRMHSCIVAFNEVGYRNLCWLTTQSNINFSYRPTIDLADLAQASSEGRLEGLLMTSGCWFGLIPTMMRAGDYASVSNVAMALSAWFDDRFYIEIQNHDIREEGHDDELYGWLMHGFAEDLGLPTVLTQDSHYLRLEDKPIHDTFKILTSFNQSEDEATFPGDGYHMADREWIEDHHHPEIFAKGMAGLEQIRQMAHLRISELDEFNLRVPDTTVSGDADAELMEAVDAAIDRFVAEKVIPASKAGHYQVRAEEEMEVVMNSGFSGFLMLGKTVCDFMRAEDIRYRVRGSATGSLVCWVLGITGYDPIKWKLSFDRFLSRDRTKPPDIDFDVEHVRRPEVLAMLEQRFYTSHISTTMKYGLTDDEGEKKGTLIGALRAYRDKSGADREAPIPQSWWHRMEKVAYYNGRQPDGTEIDPPIKSIGQHPAGMLVVRSLEDLEIVPQRWIPSSEAMVSAYDQNDVEGLGLVKLDVLGLRTLTAVRVAEELTGLKVEDFPLTDGATYRRLSKGKTTGVFQFEGWTARKGAKRMRPTKISDVIAAMALFRPAAMNSGATESLLDRRNSMQQIPERHEIITADTADTYGVLVYQEQALNIMKALGLSVEEIEKARKAIKASNANVGNAAQTLADLMDHIAELAYGKGMNAEDVKWLSNALNAYAGYSFNRAHATAYGILAYQTAYLAEHHPIEFWTGALTSVIGQGKKKGAKEKPEDTYLKAAKEDGVRVASPHVNTSQATYSTDGRVVHRGLISVQNVGQDAADDIVASAPYATLDDFAERLAPGIVTGVKDLGRGHSPAACSGMVRHLEEAGAFSGLKWRIATGPMDKAARNNVISVANKMILDIIGSRVSRKTLGEIADSLDVGEEFWMLQRPTRAQLIATTYLKEHHGRNNPDTAPEPVRQAGQKADH